MFGLWNAAIHIVHMIFSHNWVGVSRLHIHALAVLKNVVSPCELIISTLGSCYGIRKGTKVISVIVIISKNGMKGQHLMVSIISVIMLPYPNLWTLLGMLIMLWLLMDFVYMIKITRYCFIWWKSCWILSLIILMVITCMLSLKCFIMKSGMWTQKKSSSVENRLKMIVMFILISWYMYDKHCSRNPQNESKS